MKKLIGPVISMVTLLMLILVMEIFLNIFAPVPDPYEVYKHLNQYIKSEYQPNYRIKTEAEKGLPGIQDQNFFTLNNMGYRGDHLSMPKLDNEFRVFLVGGSSTECLYLDDSESIDRILQNELNMRVSDEMVVKVYNAGSSGDATPDHISMIVHRIVHLEPDMFIVFSGINDLSRSIYHYDYLHRIQETLKADYSLLKFMTTEFQIGRRVYYLLRRVSPTERQVLEEITRKSDYREKIELRKSAPVSDQRPRTDVQTYANNLRTIVGVAKAHRVQLILITQQTTWNSSIDPEAQNWHWQLFRNGETYREDYMDEALESLNDAMRQIAIEHAIPLYDLAKLMPKSLEYFYDDVHFNVKGAHTAGTQLAAFILENNLMP